MAALRVAMLGRGGVAGLIAGLLARTRSTVVVLARESTAEEIEAQGLRVESSRFGNFQTKAARRVEELRLRRGE